MLDTSICTCTTPYGRAAATEPRNVPEDSVLVGVGLGFFVGDVDGFFVVVGLGVDLLVPLGSGVDLLVADEVALVAEGLTDADVAVGEILGTGNGEPVSGVAEGAGSVPREPPKARFAPSKFGAGGV